MKYNQPLVSIGIPTYNRPYDLQKALECISEQSYLNLEIIVSDNFTPGEEVDKLVNRLMKQDARIIYFKQSLNIGAIPNFEFVFSKATGKYFLWVADDDLCEKDFIEKIVEKMEIDNELVLCGCDVKSIDENDNFIENHFLSSILVSSEWYKTRKLFFRYPTSNIFFCIYGIYRTEVLQQCDLRISSGWKGLLTNGEVPFLAQVALKGKITAIPEILKIYRRHQNSAYHKEVAKLSTIDGMMMKFIIRCKLCKLALINNESLLVKFSLINEIFNSYIVTLKGKFISFLPEKIKIFIKNMMDLQN